MLFAYSELHRYVFTSKLSSVHVLLKHGVVYGSDNISDFLSFR
jgi:hypothetical protein